MFIFIKTWPMWELVEKDFILAFKTYFFSFLCSGTDPRALVPIPGLWNRSWYRSLMSATDTTEMRPISVVLRLRPIQVNWDRSQDLQPISRSLRPIPIRSLGFDQTLLVPIPYPLRPIPRKWDRSQWLVPIPEGIWLRLVAYLCDRSHMWSVAW